MCLSKRIIVTSFFFGCFVVGFLWRSRLDLMLDAGDVPFEQYIGTTYISVALSPLQ